MHARNGRHSVRRWAIGLILFGLFVSLRDASAVGSQWHGPLGPVDPPNFWWGLNFDSTIGEPVYVGFIPVCAARRAQIELLGVTPFELTGSAEIIRVGFREVLLSDTVVMSNYGGLPGSYVDLPASLDAPCGRHYRHLAHLAVGLCDPAFRDAVTPHIVCGRLG